jgi:hypothetical protein
MLHIILLSFFLVDVVSFWLCFSTLHIMVDVVMQDRWPRAAQNAGNE